MNASQYMDKQIMDLSSSSRSAHHQGSLQSKDFIDLMNHPSQEDGDHDGATGNFSNDDNGIKREAIFPSYDFQPIGPISTSSPKLDGIGVGSARVWSSADSKINSTATPTRNYSSLDAIEPTEVTVQKGRNVFDAGIVAEIDRAMKKHTDNLLHVMEGVSARLTQVERRTQNLENSMDDLKVSFGNNQGSTDGKMRQLENILREVQTGVEVLKDKQGGVEAQLRLCNVQMSKVEQRLENHDSGHMDTALSAASAPSQSHHQLPPTTFPQSIPPLHMPSSVPPPHAPILQQNPPPPAQLPNQFPQNQIPPIPQQDPYYLPPGQTQEPPTAQYQAPPSQQPQLLPAAPPHQPYQPAPQPQYPQAPQPMQPSQLQPSLGHHHPEDTPYVPHQNYPPNLRQPPSQPSTASPPSQQYYGAPSQLYDPPSNRSGLGFSSGYGQPAGSESYPYSGPPSQYGSSSPKKPQLSAPMVQSGGSGYPQLPTARLLPQALPTTSGVGSGSGSAGSGNRDPVDDVIDKVSTMGFPRDHVRATIQKLTENGQSADLNVVLDKLTNDGEFQPPRGWFGR